MNRGLSLKRETLNDLSTDELTAVNGGAHASIVLNVCLAPTIQCYSLTTCITCGTA